MSPKRNLPSWMDKTDFRRPITNTKKSQGSTNKDARESCPRRIIYWMNEQELVETAISVLKNDNTKTDVVCTTKAKEMITETDAEETSDSAHERTYVSDTDMDVAEHETVPYGVCLEENSPSTRSHGTADHIPPHSESCRTEPGFEVNSQERNCDTDALQLVREIFFS